MVKLTIESHSGWKLIDAEPPHSDVTILVAAGGNVYPAKHLYAKIVGTRLQHHFVALGKEDQPLSNVTHWHPLPKPPPENNKQKWTPD